MGFDRSRYGAPREVSGGNNWPQDAQLLEIAEGETWSGVYLGSQRPTGRMKSCMHYFTDPEAGTNHKMWGNVVLDETFTDPTQVQKGDLVDMTNEGKRISKKTGNEYTAWKIVASSPTDGGGEVPAPRSASVGDAPGSSGSRGNPPSRNPARSAAPRPQAADPAPYADDDDIPF